MIEESRKQPFESKVTFSIKLTVRQKNYTVFKVQLRIKETSLKKSELTLAYYWLIDKIVSVDGSFTALLWICNNMVNMYNLHANNKMTKNDLFFSLVTPISWIYSGCGRKEGKKLWPSKLFMFKSFAAKEICH